MYSAAVAAPIGLFPLVTPLFFASLRIFPSGIGTLILSLLIISL